MCVDKRNAQRFGQPGQASRVAELAGQLEGVVGVQVQRPEPGTVPLGTQKADVESGVVGHWNAAGQLVCEVAGDGSEPGRFSQPWPPDAVYVDAAQVRVAGVDEGGPLPYNRSCLLYTSPSPRD